MEDAVSLETLDALKERAAIDPVRALGFRYAYADACERAISSGNALPIDKLCLWELPEGIEQHQFDFCTNAAFKSTIVPQTDEIISVIVANKLMALYRFDSNTSQWKADCVFSTGVARS